MLVKYANVMCRQKCLSLFLLCHRSTPSSSECTSSRVHNIKQQQTIPNEVKVKNSSIA